MTKIASIELSSKTKLEISISKTLASVETGLFFSDYIYSPLEGLTIAESVSLEFNKSLQPETVIATDSPPTFNIGYNPLDTVRATDDFLGEANVDDDQYTTIGKILPQGYFDGYITGYTSENPGVDNVLSQDSIQNSPNKVTSDSTTTSDSVFVKDILPEIRDTATTSESVSLVSQFLRTFDTDSTSIAETVLISQGYGRALPLGYFLEDLSSTGNFSLENPGYDIASPTEYVSLGVSLGTISDNIATSENFVKDIFLNIIDTTVSSDTSIAFAYSGIILDNTAIQDPTSPSQGYGRTLPIGYFSGSYVQDYTSEQIGYDLVKATDTITTVIT